MTVGIVGGNIQSHFIRTFVFDPASVAANTTVEQTVKFNGLRVGDIVMVTKPTLTAGLGISAARVSAPDTLAITLGNASGGAVDAPSETWMAIVFRPEIANFPAASQI